MRTSRFRVAIALLLLGTSRLAAQVAAEPLPSWNDGPTRRAIVDFVTKVTREGGPSFVPVPERIAVFDNDGTLWCEHPMYVELAFTLDRIKALAPQHPEWKTQEPFRSVLAGDLKNALAGGDKAVMELVMATHAGLSTEEFGKLARDWLATARNPALDRRDLDCVYQPMLELLTWLRANGFKTFIVTGGGQEFVRAFAEQRYGVPPEQVIGTMEDIKLETKNGQLVLEKLPKVDLIDDGPGKPVGIQRVIGRRPVMAFGNSNGDLQMLQWTTAGAGARFGLLVHHDDAKREFAYDADTHFGKLTVALTDARQRGWTVVSMRDDWKVIFPP